MRAAGFRRAYADVAHSLYRPFALPDEQLPAAETGLFTSLRALVSAPRWRPGQDFEEEMEVSGCERSEQRGVKH